MFKVNGIDIAEAYDLEVKNQYNNNILQRKAYGTMKYVAPFFRDTIIKIPQFKKNGVPIDFCMRGGRPTTGSYRFLSSSNASYREYNSEECALYMNGSDVYFSCGSVRGKINDSGNGFMVLEFQAGGGGGSGGSALFAGVGGGAGAYLAIAINIRKLANAGITKTTWNLVENDQYEWGDYSENRGQAGDGADFYLRFYSGSTEKASIFIGGGKGAKAGDEGAGGAYTETGLPLEGVEVLFSSSGQSGGAGLQSELILDSKTIKFGYDDEDNEFVWTGNYRPDNSATTYALTIGGFSNASSTAGAGGNSYIDQGGVSGGNLEGEDYNGGDVAGGSYGFGAGGGGGKAKAFSSSRGGNGGYAAVIVHIDKTAWD